MRHFLVTALGVLLFSACGADDSSSTADLFQELVSAENASASLSCNCDRETFTSVDECAAERTPSAAERRCKREQYATLPDHGAAVMACVGEAQRAWVECIEALGCKDFSSCGLARDAELAACADEATIRARCYFIDCASGEEIPSTARCNGVRDCADGSDETTCFAGGS